MIDESVEPDPGARRSAAPRRGRWRAIRKRNTPAHRRHEPLVVRWIGAVRRRKVAAPDGTPPAEMADVIVLAHVRACGLVERIRHPKMQPAGAPGGRRLMATLLPFTRPGCPA